MRRLAIIVGLVTVAACSGAAKGSADVSTYRGDSGRTGAMPGPGPTGQPGVAWQFDAGAPIGSSPAVVGDTVYVVSDDGVLHALDLATGTQVWAAPLGAETAAASPLVIEGNVILGDTAGVLHAVDAQTGNDAWRLKTDGPITGAVAAGGGVVVTATGSGVAYAVRPVTGEIAWQATLPSGVAKSVAVGSETAYLGAGGSIVALSLRDGSVTWQAEVAGDGDVGTPTVADGLVFVATGLGGDDDSAKGVVALDAAAGAIRWRYASPTQAQIYTPAVIDDRAYVVGHDQAVVALAAVTGEVVWRIETGAENEALPSVAAGVVYVPTNGGEVQALDSATGALLWTAEISGVPYAPVVTRGYVLVGTGVGTLFAIGGPK